MQLRFDDGGRDDLPLDVGEISFGGGPDDDVALPQSDPGLARLSRQPRKIMLNAVRAAQARVNGRSVAELALLRAGDLVEIGGTRMTLVSSKRSQPAPPSNGVDYDELEHRPTVSPQLRMLSGGGAGRLIPIAPELRFGSGSDPLTGGDDSAAVTITARADAVCATAAEGAALAVNGHDLSSALLRHGDQICIGNHRVELEAPAYRTGPPVTGQHDILFNEPTPQPSPVAPVDTGVNRTDKVIIGLCLAACVAMVLLVALRL